MEADLAPHPSLAWPPRSKASPLIFDVVCRGMLTISADNKSDHCTLDMDTGSETWSSSRCFSVVGVAVTSMAATALAAAGTPTPATSFALFVLLLAGLSLVSLGVVSGASGRGPGRDDDHVSLV